MRIALDARVLNTPHLRGMGKATFELLRQGSLVPDVSFAILGDEPRSPVHFPPSDRISVHTWELKGHRFRAWEQLGLPWQANRLGCDVLHCLGTWCPYWQPLPTVVTVHDTLPWDEDQPSFFLNRLLPAAYERASAIIAISDNRSSEDTSAKVNHVRSLSASEMNAPPTRNATIDRISALAVVK